ncbi:MAG TPA: hypothetical protein DCY13_14720, partial [Verrucomicrobiales bacterium]|nr:hypothetical protein [Verrucomicrobiales bacterium]
REGEFIFNARTTRVKTISVSRTSITAGLSEATSPAMQANLTIQFPRSNQFGLRLDVPDQKTRAGIELVRGTDGWSLNGGLTWQTNRADVSGSLGSDGWLPESLDVTADGWRVPAERLGLDGYRELIGGFKLGWTNRQYRFSVRGDAVPTVDNPLVPDRITIDIAGLGNFEALAVERLDIATPALQATLSDPLAIDFTGRMLVPEATLRVSADFIPADGLPF